MTEPTVWRHYAAWHRPRFYRYRVAEPGIRLSPNRYLASADAWDSPWIGLALVVGHYAYCVKWGEAKAIRVEAQR